MRTVPRVPKVLVEVGIWSENFIYIYARVSHIRRRRAQEKGSVAALRSVPTPLRLVENSSRTNNRTNSRTELPGTSLIYAEPCSVRREISRLRRVELGLLVH